MAKKINESPNHVYDKENDKYGGESMKYIKKFEDYTSMNYPDLYDEPVPNYVDVDYYDTSVIEDDIDDTLHEPANKTGREGRKKKRKSPQVFSVT